MNGIRCMHIKFKIHKDHMILMAILLFGIILRIVELGKLPLGMSHDEAYAGYEAWALYRYGIDSHGYKNPVYLTVWGSGMSALYSYLTIPFLHIFQQLSPVIIRIPQVLFGCMTLPAFYYIVSKINSKLKMLALFLLTISPWHIALSRFGLDCNLAVAFLVFGMAAFLKAQEHIKYLWLSMLCYGLSLYCYAIVWILVPFIVAISTAYLWYNKRLVFDKNVVIGYIILFFTALPLLLFVAVNFIGGGYLDEIKLTFLSIPKLPGGRAHEFGFSINNMRRIYDIIFNQYDGQNQNALPYFGICYLCSTPFMLIGLTSSWFAAVESAKKRIFQSETVMLIQFVVVLVCGCMIQEVNINKINGLFVPEIYFVAKGIYIIKDKWYSQITALVISIYLLALFAWIDEYQVIMSSYYTSGYEEALEYAIQNAGDHEIGISDLPYSYVLFETKIAPEDFIRTVKYTNYPDPWLHVAEFDRFVFDYDAELPGHLWYVLPSEKQEKWIEKGFKIRYFGDFSVAFR